MPLRVTTSILDSGTDHAQDPAARDMIRTRHLFTRVILQLLQ